MLIQKSKISDFSVFENAGKITFQINEAKATFSPRDLVSIYYFILKNIKFYLTRDIMTSSAPLKIKNAVFFSSIIDDEEKKRIKPEEINIEEADKYYRIASIVVNKNNVINLNLASLFELKRIIENFFHSLDEYELPFKEKDLKVTIQKKKDRTEIKIKKGYLEEVLKISSPIVKVLIRNLREKLIYDWKLYNVSISDKFAIYQTRTNTHLLKVNDKKIEINTDVLLGICLSI